jgi:signal recognition particle subunit SRP54
MGPLREVFAKMPMFGSFADQVEEGELVKVESLIHSMTPSERNRPESIDKSRANRIALGSGRSPKDVRDLVERFGQMRDVMASLGSGGGLLSKIPGLGKLAGAGAPGGLDPAALLGGMGPADAPGGRGDSRKRARQKGKRKQARKARRKNRRR